MTVGDRDEAARREAADPVVSRRDRFVVPPWKGGAEPSWAYFAGNSLGLPPRAADGALAEVVAAWSSLGVEGWFDATPPWLDVAAGLRPPLATLVGAEVDEVAAMSSLTVNLHLLLASFYRPEGRRDRILIEAGAFPSDSHAVAGQAQWHGLDPAEVVVRADDPIAAIEREGDRLAVVLLGAVNYLTGERLDVPAVTEAAHAVGAVVGWDLAHAIGNVPVALHDAGADFAVWCHYKYLNGGPGAPGGLFVHGRHHDDRSLPRLAGWWGVDTSERFVMAPDHVPGRGAEGWAVSTPSILGLAPVRASLDLFTEVGFDALRARSVRLTGYLEERFAAIGVPVATPSDPERRGAQLSVRVAGAKGVAARLRAEHGVVCDFREPDVLRFAPVPLSNTYDDCWRAAAALAAVLGP